MATTSLTLLERLCQPQYPGGKSVGPDQDAWNRFVELYTPLLFHWCLRTGLDDAQAEDLIQDVFIRLLTELKRFERKRVGSFRKWLQIITVNKCRERFRRERIVTETVDYDLDPLREVADPATLTVFWEEEYRQQLTERAMHLMRSEFSPHVWRACWEHVVLARPAADVAAELDITPNAVRVYSSRVLARLRHELRDLLVD